MLVQMSSSSDEREKAESRRKALLDFNTNMEGAREEGLVEGEKRGVIKGIEQGLIEGQKQGLVEGQKQGLVEGEIKGVLKGKKEGQIELLLQLAKIKFGPLPEQTIAQIIACSIDELNNLSNSIMDVENLEQWITIR